MVHLAALSHARAPDSVELRRVNVDLARNVGQAAADAGVRMVFISSVKVHGEESVAALNESSPTAPRDAYGRSKLAAEEALRRISGLGLTILRSPLVYGPGVKANFLALMAAIDHGWPLPLAAVENRRSLVYVGNLVDAILRCAHVHGTFLISDGPPISTPQLCREIGEALGRRTRLFPFPSGLLPRKLSGSLEVDDSRLRQAIGWQPPFTRRQGLKATADWYLGR